MHFACRSACLSLSSLHDRGEISPPPSEGATVQDPGDAKYYPSDEPLRLGMEYFSRGQ
jgi:hypothetical protein